LAICYFAIEIKKHGGAWTYPGMVFGSNAIVVYVFSELLSTVLEIIHVGRNGETVGLKQWIFTRIFASIVNVQFGSLLYSLSFVLVCFVPAVLLYRKRIFIKI
jgi:predicted acyltransferase